MAYSRRRYRKYKRYYRKKKGQPVYRTGIAGQVEQRLPYEQKYHDVTFSHTFTATITTDCYTVNLTGIPALTAAASADKQRVGRRIIITGLSMKGYIKVSGYEAQTGPLNPVIFRHGIIWDRAACGTLHPLTDFLVDTNIYQFYDLGMKNSFTMLYDKSQVLHAKDNMNEGAVNSFAAGQNIYLMKFHKKMWLPVDYNGTASDVSTQMKNALTFSGGIGPVFTSAVTVFIDGRIRLRFIDG